MPHLTKLHEAVYLVVLFNEGCVGSDALNTKREKWNEAKYVLYLKIFDDFFQL